MALLEARSVLALGQAATQRGYEACATWVSVRCTTMYVFLDIKQKKLNDTQQLYSIAHQHGCTSNVNAALQNDRIRRSHSST